MAHEMSYLREVQPVNVDVKHIQPPQTRLRSIVLFDAMMVHTSFACANVMSDVETGVVRLV